MARRRKTAAEPWPRLRDGYQAAPRDWIERVQRRQLTMEQLGILVAVASEANWGHQRKRVPIYNTGKSIFLARGQTLVGYRTFAERHHMGSGGRDRVRRALERGRVLGICELTDAGPTPPRATPPAPPRATPGTRPPAPPPTLVTFNRDSEILWRTPEPAPPPDGEGAPPPTPPRATPPAPIQQGDDRTSEPKLGSDGEEDQGKAPRLPSAQEWAAELDEEEQARGSALGRRGR